MNKAEIEAFIQQTNAQLRTEESVYIDVFGVGYSFGQPEDYEDEQCIHLYEGVQLGPNSEAVPLYLCVVSLMLNDESGGIECELAVKPETLQAWMKQGQA